MASPSSDRLSAASTLAQMHEQLEAIQISIVDLTCISAASHAESGNEQKQDAITFCSNAEKIFSDRLNNLSQAIGSLTAFSAHPAKGTELTIAKSTARVLKLLKDGQIDTAAKEAKEHPGTTAENIGAHADSLCAISDRAYQCEKEIKQEAEKLQNWRERELAKQ